jgi:hypothetical protein
MVCAAQAKVVIRPLDGTVASVGNDQTLVLNLPNAGTQTIQWTAQTTFVGLSADALSGQSVRVEGYLNGGVLIARVVALNPVNVSAPGRQMDDADFRMPRVAQAAPAAWQRYRNRPMH